MILCLFNNKSSNNKLKFTYSLRSGGASAEGTKIGLRCHCGHGYRGRTERIRGWSDTEDRASPRMGRLRGFLIEGKDDDNNVLDPQTQKWRIAGDRRICGEGVGSRIFRAEIASHSERIWECSDMRGGSIGVGSNQNYRWQR
ncbi:hypothetical protein Adt_33554 [Abeliophyllum distichum]|uniref:Uncharacterized protein n=1 Tax=Abeliophyllum distichum TaxID=126358 RepID=A0ABD1QWJ2_9LAMI